MVEQSQFCQLDIQIILNIRLIDHETITQVSFYTNKVVLNQSSFSHSKGIVCVRNNHISKLIRVIDEMMRCNETQRNYSTTSEVKKT